MARYKIKKLTSKRCACDHIIYDTLTSIKLQSQADMIGPFLDNDTYKSGVDSGNKFLSFITNKLLKRKMS